MWLLCPKESKMTPEPNGDSMRLRNNPEGQPEVDVSLKLSHQCPRVYRRQNLSVAGQHGGRLELLI